MLKLAVFLFSVTAYAQTEELCADAVGVLHQNNVLVQAAEEFVQANTQCIVDGLSMLLEISFLPDVPDNPDDPDATALGGTFNCNELLGDFTESCDISGGVMCRNTVTLTGCEQVDDYFRYVMYDCTAEECTNLPVEDVDDVGDGVEVCGTWDGAMNCGDDIGQGDNGQGDNGQGDNGEGDNGEGDNGEGDNGEGDNGEGDNGQGDNGQGDEGAQEAQEAQEKCDDAITELQGSTDLVTFSADFVDANEQCITDGLGMMLEMAFLAEGAAFSTTVQGGTFNCNVQLDAYTESCKIANGVMCHMSVTITGCVQADEDFQFDIYDCTAEKCIDLPIDEDDDGVDVELCGTWDTATHCDAGQGDGDEDQNVNADGSFASRTVPSLMLFVCVLTLQHIL